jgi:hypothetical protein
MQQLELAEDEYLEMIAAPNKEALASIIMRIAPNATRAASLTQRAAVQIMTRTTIPNIDPSQAAIDSKNARKR